MLKLTASPPSPPDLDRLARIPGLTEVLLGHHELARVGGLDDASFTATAQRARALGLRILLLWDILACDSDIAAGAAIVRRLDPALIDAIRVQDPGIARYVMRHFPRFPLHMILETGNHNEIGIRTWVDSFSPERIILSNEMPLAALKSIRAVVDVEIEILALGRLLVFYTPRKLISPFEADQDGDGPSQRVIVSEEDRKRFPLLENRQGTFMYYEKDLFLLPYLEEIEAAGLDHVRLDLTFYEPSVILPALATFLTDRDEASLERIKTHIGPRRTRGFYKSNRTDKQFAKLKNPHLHWEEGRVRLGTVIETKKNKYVALLTEAPIHVGDTIVFVIPEGDRIVHELRWIRNAIDRAPVETGAPGLWLIDPVKRVSSGAHAYFQKSRNK